LGIVTGNNNIDFGFSVCGVCGRAVRDSSEKVEGSGEAWSDAYVYGGSPGRPAPGLLRATKLLSLVAWRRSGSGNSGPRKRAQLN